MRLAAIYVFVAVASNLIAYPTTAQDKCFCLQHQPSEAIYRYGCISELNNLGNIRVTCQDASLAGHEEMDRKIMDDQEQFTRIPGGEGMCNPCEALRREEIVRAIRNLEIELNFISDSAQPADK